MQSSYAKDPPRSTGAGQEYNDSSGVVSFHLTTPSNYFTHSIKYWQARLSQDTNLTNRVLAHAIMVVVIGLAVILSSFNLSWGTISAVRPLKQDVAESPAAGDTQEINQPLTLPRQLDNIQDDVLFRAAVPHTIILDRSQTNQTSAAAAPITDISTYSVNSGDTISGIAAKFGLAPETIIWSNPELEDNPDLLSVGQIIKILPVDGVYHQVGSGDTIDGIASTFKADPSLIINLPANELDPENPVIVPGQWLIVPGGQKPFKPRAVTAYSGPIPADATLGTGIFGWPSSGEITQGYYGYHPGIDVGGWLGAPVLAADSGYVVAAGWDDTGYGLSVVIDHGNGFQTLYAHMNDYFVEPGTNVAKGQQIGEIGNTGNATGPHLHFEIRHGTVQRNPYGFLP